MAESQYVNVRESKVANKIGKGDELHCYTNVEFDCPNKEKQCEDYQIVQEQCRDPKGEYTDLTVTGQPSEATLKREKMTHAFLFSPQKTVRRFNYTDIQLPPSGESSERQQLQSDTRETSKVPSHNQVNKKRPQLMPKPKNIIVNAAEEQSLHDEENESFQSEEADYVYTVDEQAADKPSFNLHCKICTWKCNAVIYLLLLVVSVSISLIAIAVAVTAFTSQACSNQDVVFGDCMFTYPRGYSNCTTTPIMIGNMTQDAEVRTFRGVGHMDLC